MSDSEFRFSKQGIDQHVETIGLRLQSQIDLKDDRTHLQQFFNQINEKYPALFEGLAHQPGQSFLIKKTITSPGKGRMEGATCSISPQGVQFSFPRTIPGFLDDYEWPRDLNEQIAATVEVLKQHLPLIKITRVGKKREIIFDCGSDNSYEIVAAKFMKSTPANLAHAEVRWNDANDQYNRHIWIAAKVKQMVSIRDVSGLQVRTEAPAHEFGIQVILDVNNRKMDRALEEEDLKVILDYADGVFAEELVPTLNGESQ